ncbi:pancreatic triacylglycerol lipase-like isoform X12 [Hyposmocoma kahamanoa]|uniref:pancreatic triacylglycerol lipase-like isoform X12 n=1 Tax=Hyposmocoma kahamanoa TaxID=1477025 RepID=UPI000E6D6DF6|nr:pancreatic triacylglycerol lipase-like isoform X12 [Hyposmocoma kahamanoa]
MSYLLPLLVSCLLSTALANSGYNETAENPIEIVLKGPQNFFEDVGKGIQKEVADIKQPVEEAAVYIGSSQCSNVKKIVGVAYEQVQGEKEPDLDQLSLNFITNDFSITYKLNRAAQLIPQSQGYNPHQKLYIYIHGFTDDPSKNSFTNISTALFSQGLCNVLALDGSSLIHWLYLRSTTYVRLMGEKLGEVLASMTQSGVDPTQIHVIGHSLGSHIAGFTGKQFTKLTGMRVGRISGLDPAGPCFSHVDDDLRLKETDADYVDVIHTDAGVFGLKDPVGHVDYYPNAGAQQPNCFFQTCSHSRAWLYYAESVVDPKAFPALKCNDWDSFKIGNCSQDVTYISFMGHASMPGTTGLYFLQTADNPPFGLGEAGIRYKNKDGIIKNLANGMTGMTEISELTGQTATYRGSDFNDKPVFRQGPGLAVVKKIGQRIEKVIQKVIQIAKYIINKDDCELDNKQDVVELWEKKNKQVLDMAQEILPNMQEDDKSLSIDTLTELLNYLKANKNTTDSLDNDVKPEV